MKKHNDLNAVSPFDSMNKMLLIEGLLWRNSTNHHIHLLDSFHDSIFVLQRALKLNYTNIESSNILTTYKKAVRKWNLDNNKAAVAQSLEFLGLDWIWESGFSNKAESGMRGIEAGLS